MNQFFTTFPNRSLSIEKLINFFVDVFLLELLNGVCLVEGAERKVKSFQNLLNFFLLDIKMFAIVILCCAEID